MKTQERTKLRGFARVQITEDGKVVGDSGYRENTVMNLGFNNYLVQSLGSISGSKYISHAALGTGGAPAASETTTLSGEVVKRQAVTAATTTGSKTLNMIGTFASANSFVTATANISNIGLFDVSNSTTAAQQIFAGTVYTSSACATNQNVNFTYNIIFA